MQIPTRGHTVCRRVRPIWALGAVALQLCVPAILQAQTNEITVLGGTAMPGETVNVEVRLGGPDVDAAAAASLVLLFPADLVTPVLPVPEGCAIDERLAGSHQVTGDLAQPGTLVLQVSALAGTQAPLGDGPLARCDFSVDPAAMVAVAALLLDAVGLADGQGGALPVAGVPGSITIGTAPACGGDCDGDGQVTVAELVRGARIALGEMPLDDCPAVGGTGGDVEIAELVGAVNHALAGCTSM